MPNLYEFTDPPTPRRINPYLNDADSGQVAIIIECLNQMCTTYEISASQTEGLAESIRQEYQEFHSTDAPVQGSANWKNTRVRFLYPHDVRINEALCKRAFRHIRSMVRFNDRLDRIAACYGSEAVPPRH